MKGGFKRVIRMGISDCKRFADYEQWLKKAYPGLRLLD